MSGTPVSAPTLDPAMGALGDHQATEGTAADGGAFASILNQLTTSAADTADADVQVAPAADGEPTPATDAAGEGSAPLDAGAELTLLTAGAAPATSATPLGPQPAADGLAVAAPASPTGVDAPSPPAEPIPVTDPAPVPPVAPSGPPATVEAPAANGGPDPGPEGHEPAPATAAADTTSSPEQTTTGRRSVDAGQPEAPDEHAQEGGATGATQRDGAHGSSRSAEARREQPGPSAARAAASPEGTAPEEPGGAATVAPPAQGAPAAAGSATPGTTVAGAGAPSPEAALPAQAPAPPGAQAAQPAAVAPADQLSAGADLAAHVRSGRLVEPPRPHMTLMEAYDWTQGLVRIARGDGFANARISLAPPELGQLEIRLSFRGGRLTAEIAADTVEAMQALGASASELRRSLEATGVHVADVTITHNPPEERSSTGGRDGNQAGPGDDGRDTDAHVASADDQVTVASTAEIGRGAAVDVLA